MKGLIFLGLFGLVFASVGAIAAIGIVKQGHNGGNESITGGIIVCSVFILIGLGIVALAVFGYKASKAKEVLKQKHPNQPWLQERNWAEGRIKDSNKGSFIATVIFALFWNGISWTTIIAAYRDGAFSGGFGLVFLVGLFPLVGLYLIYLATQQGLKYLKFGTSVFEMAEVPGVIGGTIGGVIFTKVNIAPNDGFLITLKCIRKYTTGSGKNRSTQRETLWETSSTVAEDALSDDRSQSAIPVLLDIPYDCRPTEEVGSRESIYWEVSAHASTPGVDFDASFQVPAYKTEKSNADQTIKSLRRQQANTTSEPGITQPEQPIPHLTIDSNFAEATTYTFAAYRNTAKSIIPLLIGIGTAVGAYYLFREGGMMILFGVFLSLFSLIFLLSSLELLKSALTVKTSKSGIQIRNKRIFSESKHEIRVSDIDSITLKDGFKTGNNAYFDILIELESGKKFKIPAKINGRTDANRFISFLETDLGLL